MTHRCSFAWAQHPESRQWWLVEMENGEPRRAFLPPAAFLGKNGSYDASDPGAPSETMDRAHRDSFVHWSLDNVPKPSGPDINAGVNGPRTSRGFRIFHDERNEQPEPTLVERALGCTPRPQRLSVVESSIAGEGAYVRIYGGRAADDHVHLSYAQAKAVRDALDQFLIEAEHGMLTEDVPEKERSSV